MLARRNDTGPARTVTLPWFAAVVRGGDNLVAKQVGQVTVSFADGQDRAQARLVGERPELVAQRGQGVAGQGLEAGEGRRGEVAGTRRGIVISPSGGRKSPEFVERAKRSSNRIDLPRRAH